MFSLVQIQLASKLKYTVLSREELSKIKSAVEISAVWNFFYLRRREREKRRGNERHTCPVSGVTPVNKVILLVGNSIRGEEMEGEER